MSGSTAERGLSPEDAEAVERAKKIEAEREVRWERLPIDELVINPGYQRDSNDSKFKARFRDIVDNYNAALFDALRVAEDHGEKVVWDGQCRLAAAKRRREMGCAKPGDEVMCQIIEATEDEQADLFILQEHRRQLSWAERHHAFLHRRDERAVAIQEVFDDLGLKLGHHPNGARGDVRAVQACYSTIEIDRTKDNPKAPLRPDLLREILVFAEHAWREVSPEPGHPYGSGVRMQYATSDRMIDALALLFNEFSPEEMPRHDLAVSLREYPPAWLVRRASMRTSVHGSNNKGMLASEIIGVFNRATGHKLQKGRVLHRKLAKQKTRTRRARRTASVV